MNRFDVAVIGLGATGSAAALAIARLGRRVVAFDRAKPPHTLGSSHGRTRIIREAYYEDPAYVPIVQRAYEGWEALAHDTGRTLFRRTGGLMIGPPTGHLVAGAQRSARAHAITHEVLDAAAIRRRFPAFTPEAGWAGVLEHRAGLLFPEDCITAALEVAARLGAELHVEEEVTRWEPAGDGVSLTTERGRYGAERLVIAAGPWLTDLVPELRLPVEVERQTFHWFAPVAGRAAEVNAAECPIALWEYEPDRIFATFPDVGHGVKAGVHHEGAITTPGSVDRTVSAAEDARVTALVERLLPAAAGALLDKRVCLYTNTPDHHFLIDAHPEHPRVLLASPCSGHGFKFATAIGEIIAELVTMGSSRFDVSLFRLDRFGERARSA